MQSLCEKLGGIVAAFVILCFSTGHSGVVWKSLAYLHYQALKEIQKPWGNPSIFRHSTPHGQHNVRFFDTIQP